MALIYALFQAGKPIAQVTSLRREGGGRQEPIVNPYLGESPDVTAGRPIPRRVVLRVTHLLADIELLARPHEVRVANEAAPGVLELYCEFWIEAEPTLVDAATLEVRGTINEHVPGLWNAGRS